MFYNDALILRLKQERELFDLLDSSLENGDFRVYLQPKILLDSGKIGGAEALIRWRHPQRGLISPAEFVPLFKRIDHDKQPFRLYWFTLLRPLRLKFSRTTACARSAL